VSGLEQLVSAVQQRPGAQSGRPGQRHPRWTASSPPSTSETSPVRFAAFSSIIAALLANCCGARVSAVGAVCGAALGRGRQRSGRLSGGVGSSRDLGSNRRSSSAGITILITFISLTAPLVWACAAVRDADAGPCLPGWFAQVPVTCPWSRPCSWVGASRCAGRLARGVCGFSSPF
jgi:hypothetical protein